MIRLAWLAAICLLAGRTAVAAAAPVAVPSAQYARTVSQVATRLEAAAKTRQPTTVAARALLDLPDRAAVRVTPEAAPLQVDNRELLAELRREVKSGPAGIRTAAGVLRNVASAVAISAAPAPKEARIVLGRVLARREFGTSVLDVWRDKVNRWKMRVVMWIFDHLPHANVPPRVWRVLGYVLLVATGAAIVYLLVTLLVGIGARPRPMPDAPDLRPTVVLPYSAWLAEAEQRFRAGDYRAAVRALHMAALTRLDDAGLLRYDGSYTDTRFVHALRAKGQQELAGVLVRLNHLFAAVWYGRRAAGPAEYSTAQTLWAELEATVRP